MQKINEKLKGLKSGLVISYFGNSVSVEAEDGQVFQCHLRRNQELPVVGDRVSWEWESEATGIITGIEPRRSQLAKGDGHGKMKPLAANIDALVVVMSPPPIFSEHLVDRYLVAAEILKLPAILLVNKSDLLDASKEKETLLRLKPYQNIPYPVGLTSVMTQAGLPELAALLKNKSAVLVGPSGVGKSSIISALGHVEPIRVGDVSRKGSGKHTTTATRLYHLPQGGNLIDSPGVREFSLWPISKQQVLEGFKEFHPFLTGCKFRNCLHLVEPGCAVQAAVENDKISKMRFASYQALMKESSEYNPYAK